MTLTKLDTLLEMARGKKTSRLVVAAAEDEPVLEAVRDAMKEKIVVPILVGDAPKIKEIAAKVKMPLDGVEIVDEKSPAKSSRIAVQLIREGKGDIMMKGLVGTADLLRAVLDKENGLRKGDTISHVALSEVKGYHKLLAVTDAALTPAPTFDQKVAMINNAAEVFHKLGIKEPKVAVLCAAETVSEKIEASVHAAMLAMMNRRGQIKGCIVDGPLALDNAVSKEACEHKKIKSDVGGDADILLCPDIEAANILYKSINFLAGATTAAVLMGAKVPIVLTSRADTDRSKLFSIALAASMEL
ncbi:MAG TPA: bifunctional enoyl-CoA hydratase/phosphate acetyltransferase [bacterium]|nr:bifunctional enoyl-CoA hydratase/phosphate acetyltransferase [bacterium]